MATYKVTLINEAERLKYPMIPTFLMQQKSKGLTCLTPAALVLAQHVLAKFKLVLSISLISLSWMMTRSKLATC